MWVAPGDGPWTGPWTGPWIGPVREVRCVRCVQLALSDRGPPSVAEKLLVDNDDDACRPVIGNHHEAFIVHRLPTTKFMTQLDADANHSFERCSP